MPHTKNGLGRLDAGRWCADSQPSDSAANVSAAERLSTAAVGAFMIGIASRGTSFSKTLLATLGGALVYRAISGHCPLYSQLSACAEAVDPQTESRLEHLNDQELDIVQEASEESFPASDPPPWTSGRGRFT